MKKKTMDYKTVEKKEALPSKAYDPHKLFRQRKESDYLKMLQNEDDVMKEEYKFKGDSPKKYSKIKQFLKRQK